MIISGQAHVFSDNVNTDEIIPARYLNSSDPSLLAAHCMEDIDADFVHKVHAGDIVVAGRNFGCGSSREHAPIALHSAGIECVIAASFASIFFRNAINTGLAIMECPDAARGISEGDSVRIDADEGIITDLTNGGQWHAAAFPPFLKKIIEAGGLAQRTRMRLAQGDGRV